MNCAVTYNRVIALVMVAFAVSTPLLSQSPGTGAIAGTVIDSSGALLAKGERDCNERRY